MCLVRYVHRIAPGLGSRAREARAATPCTLEPPCTARRPVIGREKRMLPGHYLEERHSKSAIARQLGISRYTIRRWDGSRLSSSCEETAAEPPRPTAIA